MAVGDHVVMVFMPSCGQCLPCAEGRPALCEPGAAANGAGTLLSGFRRLHRDGTDVNHHLGVSGFAEFAVVSRRSVVKVDKDLPLDEAALFGCAVLTGVGAVVNTGQLGPASRRPSSVSAASDLLPSSARSRAVRRKWSPSTFRTTSFALHGNSGPATR